MEISEIIAVNLKRLREERNLSLGQLAELAGVSKVMLSQLEKGTSNPTINTVWKITGALKLPYTSLLDLPESEVVHVKKKDIHDLEEDKYHIFSYYAKDANRPFELYQIEMDTGCIHESIGHSSDSSEYIMVIDGKMELEVNGKTYVLEPDDGFCFEAATPHIYRNISDKKVKLFLMIYYTA
ncbi:MAG: XRE family transcriptional regulator [Lachnospiraceae bacterium]|nr:XRE family transcriptional regulator [Lachnospiraceae bacterium]